VSFSAPGWTFAPAGDLEFLCFDIGYFGVGFSNSVATDAAQSRT